ncbi:hypothetical protein [Microcoleus sp. Pol10D4]|uniref:hypothetical protein n=1 Tax=Microcoleus sp. Pol10D4 TaxID=3055387 RepID=UPI002FD3CCEF
MVRIINCCYTNLNQKNNTIDEALGDDITSEIIIGDTPVTLLSSANINRKIIKIYTSEYSNPLAVLWVRHGTGISQSNFTLAIPNNHLYVNTSQASRPLSVMCSEGTALIKFTVVNKS